MGCYNVEWKRSARHDLRTLDRLMIARVLAAVGGLSETPRPPGCKKLRGAEQTYRIRVGDYRIVYSVSDDEQLVVILLVGHRRDVYRGLG
ncbi:MAG: type II toxin-antitoxin system RelE/ParE family toxin [Planctomycetes bacterium]|nr:type II toxin-antitoxin system RelE/ParE family toxin [Planctomycetota bacterium]